ncbi:hypothetical protein J4233_02685 [Candidatus Pacearchaeota archaeon]|nr:hypothetical protein [Candidatus Pacearchaeota archaeon]
MQTLTQRQQERQSEQRDSLSEQLRSLEDEELLEVAVTYETYQLSGREHRAEQIQGMPKQRAELIEQIHYREEVRSDVYKKRVERTFGHDGAQPPVGYFLAYHLLARNLRPDRYQAPRRSPQSPSTL